MQRSWPSTSRTLSILLAIVLLAIGVFLLVRHSGPLVPEDKRHKIGAILPLTGDAATYGTSCRKGMEIAASGMGLRVVFEDSAADPKLAVSAFQKLESVDLVEAVLGDMFSAPTLAFAPIAQTREVVVISPTSGAEAVPRTGSSIFSLYPTARIEGEYMAQYASSAWPQGGTAGIFASQEEVYTDLAKGFAEKLANLSGWSHAFIELLPPDTRDFKNPATKLVQWDDVNVVFVAGAKTFVANLIKQARQLGYSGTFLSQSTLVDPTLVEDFGAFLEGVLFSGPYFQADAATEPTKTFVANFQASYGEPPDVWAAYGFDAVLAISTALKACPSCKGSKLAAEVARLSLEGTTGSLSFGEGGVALRSFRVYTFRDGTLVPIS